ncbi:SCO2400 family protein [Streptomyces sp. JNUCC 63]
MDYCSSCRRHLNGALVCPGCGAYAPDIAPPAADTRTGSAWGTAPTMTGDAPGTTNAGESGAPDAWHDGLLHGEAEPGPGTSTAPSTDVEGIPPARQGRAARRRQLARWKKNKRRAAVATAVALVGGGLTIAAMDRDATSRAQAATAPDDRGMGIAEEQTSQHTHPAPTPPTTHRSSHTTPEHTSPGQTTPKTQSPATNAPRQQALPAPQRATPPIARPDAAASPRPAATSAPQPQNTAPSSDDTAPDRTGTAAERPSAPAASGGTNSGTSLTDPAPASTPPKRVCLLVVCLG